jgi:hypothetical protein
MKTGWPASTSEHAPAINAVTKTREGIGLGL